MFVNSSISPFSDITKYLKVDFLVADSDMTTASAHSFWQWRRPKFTNNGTPTDIVPSGSATEALWNLFGDLEVSDTLLQGNDGGNICAVKAILSSRSPMFRQKFFGSKNSKKVTNSKGEEVMKLSEDKEQKSWNTVVEIVDGRELYVFKDWDCRILHLIVEFCYTDTCSVFKTKPTEESTRLIAHLRVAAKAFKLTSLDAKVKQWSWKNLNRHPALACAMIDEGMKRDDIDDLALQILQLKTRVAMLPDSRSIGTGVLSLTKPGLLFVLRTMEDTTSHVLLLRIIEKWTEFSSDGDSGDSPIHERHLREAFGRKCALRFIKVVNTNPNKEALELAIKKSKLFHQRNDISATSMSLLDEGIQFTEKATRLKTKDIPKPRPHTAIGLVYGSSDMQTTQVISQ